MKRFVRNLLESVSSAGPPSRVVASLGPIILVLSAGTLSISSLHRQYTFTSKEIQGTFDIEYLAHLKTALKESRGLRQFEGDLPGQDLILHTQQGILKHGDAHEHEHEHHHEETAASAIEPVSSAETTIDDLVARNREEVAQSLSSKQWLGIRRRYGFYRGDVKVDLVRRPDSEGFKYSEDFERFTNRINELNEYFALVADRSNLILDPEIDTYYLMSLAASTLPSITDLIAEVRGQRVAYDLRGKGILVSDDKEAPFVRFSYLLDDQLANLNRTINILGYASPVSYKALEIDRLDLVDKINALSFGIRSKQSLGFAETVKRWNESTQLIAILQDIQFKGISILRMKLEERRRDLIIQIVLISVLLLSGSFLIYFVNNRLFAQLTNALADIKELANTDSLTKLLSRRSLPHLYQRAMAADTLDAGGLGICLFDIDFFKRFNDSYGHLQGDDALVKVATFLKDSLLRQTDYAFRYGGEEFLIMFAAASEKKFEYFLQTIRRGVENLQIEHCSSEVSDYLTVSMGGVFIPHKKSDLELEVALLQADRELYKVKASSRNAVSIITLSRAMQSDLEREINADRDRRSI